LVQVMWCEAAANLPKHLLFCGVEPNSASLASKGFAMRSFYFGFGPVARTNKKRTFVY
jgi:hypothetical protein